MTKAPRIEQNAIITSAELTRKDYDILSLWLHLDLGGGGIGFGGFSLGGADAPRNYAAIWIERCLDVAGVDSWDKLKGRPIRIQMDSWNGPVQAIGHILNDDWFEPRKVFAKENA